MEMEYDLNNGYHVTVKVENEDNYLLSVVHWTVFRGSYTEYEYYYNHADYFKRMAELAAM